MFSQRIPFIYPSLGFNVILQPEDDSLGQVGENLPSLLILSPPLLCLYLPSDLL